VNWFMSTDICTRGTCGKACQCPYFSFLLVFICYYFLLPFLPDYPLLNHFTPFCSLHFVHSFLWLFISPSTFCIHLLCLHIRFHLFIFNSSFLACIIHCSFWYLLFPLLWLSSVFNSPPPPPYLYVSSWVFSPHLSTQSV
jgi:hypothetical protein